MTVEISVGKERYKLFKRRYWIQIGNETTYYYSEYIFWEKFFEVCEQYEVKLLDRDKLGFSIK